MVDFQNGRILRIILSISASYAAVLSACFLDNQQFGIKPTNIFDSKMNTSINGCSESYQSNVGCITFTHFAEDSSPFQNTCFLRTSCPTLYPCQDCVTESVTNDNNRNFCVASLTSAMLILVTYST